MSGEPIYFASPAQWRAWLEDHHASETEIWVGYHKAHTKRPSLTWAEAVREALCFGWIDSRPGTVDDDRTRLVFTPRKVRSPWSALNKRRVAKLIEDGLMTPAGMARIEAAKANGDWEIYDGVESLIVPDDLAAALSAKPEAKMGFEQVSASQTKQLLWWIESAKRPETRAKRLARLVDEAADGRNPLDWRAKQTAKEQG